jgi:hypothetical protein
MRAWAERKLELFPEPSQVEATAPFLEERPEKKSGSPVFVAHGHDEVRALRCAVS